VMKIASCFYQCHDVRTFARKFIASIITGI
jgi:hypothetical protein